MIWLRFSLYLIAVAFIGLIGLVPAHDQGYQCRTSPVGTSTSYCASEAFVTQQWAVTANGRLTLSTATPVMVATVSGATTVYLTPYYGNVLPLYNGTNFVPRQFSELSQTTTDTTKSPAAVTTNSNYDIFAWSDSGTTRATRGPAWSSNTSRGTGAGTTELVNVSGIWLNKNDITNGPKASRGTYYGTIRSNGSSTIDYNLGAAASGGTAGILGVWNNFNRRLALAQVVDNGVSYTYTTNTIRQARASAGNQIAIILGWQEDAVIVAYQQRIDLVVANFSNGVYGIGIDSTTTFTNDLKYFLTLPTNTSGLDYATPFSFPLAITAGYHVISANEKGDGTNANTFDSNNSATLSAAVMN